jgi:hypothetical protein
LRVRIAAGRVARPFEVALVATLVLVVWLLALGWDWASDAGGIVRDPPQSTLDWVILGITAMVAAGWLGLRGRAIAGTLAVCVPVVALSGWRMAASAVVDWPTGLASLVFVLSAMCMAAAAFGAGVRRLRA